MTYLGVYLWGCVLAFGLALQVRDLEKQSPLALIVAVALSWVVVFLACMRFLVAVLKLVKLLLWVVWFNVKRRIETRRFNREVEEMRHTFQQWREDIDGHCSKLECSKKKAKEGHL